MILSDGLPPKMNEARRKRNLCGQPARHRLKNSDALLKTKNLKRNLFQEGHQTRNLYFRTNFYIGPGIYKMINLWTMTLAITIVLLHYPSVGNTPFGNIIGKVDTHKQFNIQSQTQTTTTCAKQDLGINFKRFCIFLIYRYIYFK